MSANGDTVDTGTITDKKYGTGAVVVVVKSAPAGSTTADYTSRAFFKRGSLGGKGTVTATSNPDKSISYTGTFTATRGTGAFKGVTGTGTITGSSPANDTAFATLTLQGTFTL